MTQAPALRRPFYQQDYHEQTQQKEGSQLSSSIRSVSLSVTSITEQVVTCFWVNRKGEKAALPFQMSTPPFGFIIPCTCIQLMIWMQVARAEIITSIS